MAQTLQTVLAWLGGTVAIIAACTGAAYWLFKTYATKWIDNRFATQLEAQKHELNKVLEQHKHELSTLFDRATRLHAQEFEVLPALWERLCLSLNSAQSTLGGGLIMGNDISGVSTGELEEMLKQSPLFEHERQMVRQAGPFDRSALFAEYERQHHRRSAGEAWKSFQNYATAKSIFIDPSLSAKIDELISLIAVAFRESAWSRMDPRDSDQRKAAREASKKLMDDGERLRKEIEATVSSRLRASANDPQ